MAAMQIGLRVFLASLLLNLASAAQLVLTKSKESPVAQVVTLLEELKSRTEADGVSEQASYDKFACWCEDTLGEKATEISKSKEQIDELQTNIVKLKGDIAAHQVEIKQLEKDIAANIESTREATEMREKESEGYEGEKTESEQCIGALEAAIKVLQGAGASSKSFLGTLQEAQLLGVVAGVRNVLRRPSVEKQLDDKDLAVVRRFVDRPEDFVGGRTGVLTAVQIANNPFGDYAPQSTQIQGILKGMYDSFAADQEKANHEEAEKQKAFEDLMVTKRAELKTLQETLETHTTDEATKTKDLADDKKLLDDTKEQLEADEEFFAQTKGSCKQKANDWASRTRLRTEELQGMTQAIAILSSDEAKATFENATSLVQLASVRSMEPQRKGAYMQLRTLATKFQSLSLARLAASVKTTGHFDKIIADIDKMIAVLHQEEKDDIAHRDTCEKNQNKNKNVMEDLGYDITKSESAINRMGDEATELQGKVAALDTDINQTKTGMEDLKDMRSKEHADFVQGVQDDTDAVALLEKAISHLAGFYERNKIPVSLAQKRADPMPETNWQGGDYGGRKTESTGILAILGMIKEDLEKEVKVARQEDAAAQKMFEADRTALTNTLHAQEASKLAVEKELAALNLKIADIEEFQSQKQRDLEGEQAVGGSLTEDCAWVESHFESRRTARKNEIDGLVDAKNFLAGVDADE